MTTPPLTLALFGRLEAVWDGQPIGFATSAARALLAYVAVEGDRAHARESLAALLWPEHSATAAYANLRQTLARVRKALPASAEPAALLTVTTQLVQLNRADVAVDVQRFAALLRSCAEHPHRALPRCAVCMERYQEAAALYRGDLLDGVSLPPSEAFDEWLLVMRERLRQQALAVLKCLTEANEYQGDYAAMRAYAARQLAIDPWREAAHAQAMRALAFAGDRAAALAQYAACQRILAQDLGVTPSSELTELYEAIRAGQLHAPAPVAPHRPSVALPAPPTQLVGRDAELDTIARRLREPHCRLVTLTGPGGVGKTHLALAAAHLLQDVFPDGVSLVALAPIADPALVLPTMLQALAIDLPPARTAFEALVDTLADQRRLLVVDNLEQVLGAAPQLAELLSQTAGLKLLATSRAALRVRAEYEVPVLPLAIPPQPWTADAVATAPAVALFVRRAQAIRPDFALTEANAATLASICARLDGLPLAIELAAARVRLLPPDQLLHRLDRRLDLLTAGMHDLPARHQTLRQTIDWSINLLGSAEQTLFGRLGVFVGGATLDAIEAICPPSAGAPLPVLDALQALVDNSLVRQSVGEDGVARFGMLETVRECAVERLERAAEAERLRERHAGYYLRLAEAAAPELAGGPAQVTWFTRVAADLDNLRAALRWAAAQALAPAVLRIGVALREFWMTRAYLAEGRQWLEAGLALAADAALPPDEQLRARALTTAGWLAANSKDFAAAERLLGASLTLARGAAAPAQILAALGDLGQAARMQNDLDRATALYNEALTLSRAVCDTRSTAWTLCNLGIIAHAQRRDAEVAPLLDEGIAASTQLGDRICAAWCLTFLARVAKDRGSLRQSAELFARTLAIFRDVGHADGIAFTLEGRAALAVAFGDQRAAAMLFGTAEALREAINRVQPLYERDIVAPEAIHDPVAWRSAWAEGRARPVEQVLAEVLGAASRVAR